MVRASRERQELLESPNVMACVASFLTDSEAKSLLGATGMRQAAGRLGRILELVNPHSEHNLVAQLARGMARLSPSAAKVRDSIFDIDVLLTHLADAYSDNDALSREDLRTKTMMLVMIFSACRPAELARMELPPSEDVRREEVRLRTITKQRGGALVSVVVRRISEPAICPVAAVQAWLQRRGDIALPYLLVRCDGEETAVDTKPDAGSHAADDMRAAPSRNVSPMLLGGPVAECDASSSAFSPPRNPRTLTAREICAAFRTVMAAAGIPPRYTPYCIKHAVVTKLFSRGASLEQVNTFGRWARGSRVPLLFYNITSTDGQWIGA
jgi:hypothetical protein